ncbi:MAG: Sec-independent protein translocase protein TatB [Azoarcus sp.]|nr:Sec-independent protein translocase protein TatB [Azoarcus sp.]
MFDFGFSELVLIGVVLLIVVGPQRLPKVARTAGHLLGRLQRYVSDVKTDIQREMQLDELKKLQQQVQQQAQEMESSVRSQVNSLESGLGQAADEVRSVLPDASVGAAVPAKLGEYAGAATSAEKPSSPPEPSVDGPQLELGLDPAARHSAPADKV